MPQALIEAKAQANAARWQTNFGGMADSCSLLSDVRDANAAATLGQFAIKIVPPLARRIEIGA